MTVGKREFSGKGAREEAGKALNDVIMSWKNDKTLKVRAHYRGFEILSRGSQWEGRHPDLYVRGKATYEANLNPDSPAGTIASIDHVFRTLDRRAEQEQQDVERQEKALTDYKAQLGKGFEHEDRLKELQAKQAQLNAALDLDKHESQVVAEGSETEKATSFVERCQSEEKREAAIAP